MKDAPLVEISSTQSGKEEWALTLSLCFEGPRIVSAGGYDEMVDGKFSASQQHLLKIAKNGRSLRG
jgi:hypothetical protein